jgi:hypothetical protein
MIGLEIGLFFMNKSLSGAATISATNIEIALITVVGWWYVNVHAYADGIRAAQKKVLKIRPGRASFV